MGLSLNYRGNIRSKQANATVQWLKNNNHVYWMEWSSTGFKISLNDELAAMFKDDHLILLFSFNKLKSNDLPNFEEIVLKM